MRKQHKITAEELNEQRDKVRVHMESDASECERAHYTAILRFLMKSIYCVMQCMCSVDKFGIVILSVYQQLLCSQQKVVRIDLCVCLHRLLDICGVENF